MRREFFDYRLRDGDLDVTEFASPERAPRKRTAGNSIFELETRGEDRAPANSPMTVSMRSGETLMRERRVTGNCQGASGLRLGGGRKQAPLQWAPIALRLTSSEDPGGAAPAKSLITWSG
jgi:hypothetical protein